MDDFSFPTVVADPDSLLRLPFPHFAASPLWFLPSPSQPNPPRRRRSFASAADAYGTHSDGEEENGFLGKLQPSSPALSDDESTGRFFENEKMDMLWEDFNEELARLSYHRRQPPEEKRPGSAKPRVGSKPRSKGDHPRGSQALAMTKSGSSSIRHGRPGLAVMLKLLKRLFMVQNPWSSRKTRHFDGGQDAPAA